MDLSLFFFFFPFMRMFVLRLLFYWVAFTKQSLLTSWEARE